MRRRSVLTRGSIPPRGGDSAAYRGASPVEDAGLLGEDPQDVGEDQRGLDLVDDLVGVRGRIQVALLLGGHDLLAQTAAPARDVNGDAVAHGPRPRGELRDPGYEEAPAGEDRALHVGDPVLDVAVQARQAALLLLGGEEDLIVE